METAHSALTAQVRLQRGIIQQSCMPRALRVLVDIDVRGRFLKNIPQPFHGIISLGVLILNAFYDQKFYFQNIWQFKRRYGTMSLILSHYHDINGSIMLWKPNVATNLI